MHIIIIDDHELVRDGIKNLVEQEFGWHVLFDVAAIEELPNADVLADVDVAIIDISLQEASGFDVLNTIKTNYPDVRCLMVSMYEHVGYISKALELGADGYVTKTAATKELMCALDALENGDNYLSSDLSNKLAFGHNNAFSELTEREREVFLLLARGLQPKRISSQLNTMPKTIMVHRTNIYHKLGVTSQFELLRIALNEGILSLDDFIHAPGA
tara:strand:- start:3135 stop:3779 length:645 start_codon:yes stop_codon:yes gene_type:complete